MVSNLDIRDAVTDTLDDSAALVSEDDRERALGVVSRELSCEHSRDAIVESATWIFGAEERSGRRGRSEPRATTASADAPCTGPVASEAVRQLF